MSSFEVGLCQMPVVDNLEINLRTAEEYIHICAENGANVVVLPEMFCCPYNNESFVRYREPSGGRIWASLQAFASKNKVYLIGGSMPEVDEEGRIYNTSFIFSSDGTQISKHRKMHLFDIDVKGGQYFKESNTFTPGDQITVVETEYGKIGVAICFDMRFSEMSRLMAKSGCILLVYPAAFNMTTGPAHWETTLRARAIDNQVYVAACSPARDESSSYIAYGHSIIVSPWGDIKKEMGAENGTIIAEISLDYMNSIREQLPIIKGIRDDIYTLPSMRKT